MKLKTSVSLSGIHYKNMEFMKICLVFVLLCVIDFVFENKTKEFIICRYRVKTTMACEKNMFCKLINNLDLNQR